MTHQYREKGEVPESFPGVSRERSRAGKLDQKKQALAALALARAKPHHLRLKAALHSTSYSVGFIGLAKQRVFKRNDEVDLLSSLSWPRLVGSPIFHQREWTRLQLQRAYQLRTGGVQK